VELPKGQVNSNINVTPLVDVMLVLLIIFMVVTPMLQKGASVQLPVTDEPIKQEEGKDQILLAVQYGGDPNAPSAIDIAQGSNKEKVAVDSLGPRLAEYFQRDPSTTVVIKGDRRLNYGVVKKAMLDVKKAGFQQVGLITQPKAQEQGS
jgi:biopolymer transport protein ExbD